MAQFDVHRNPGRSTTTLPDLVVIRSAWFDAAIASLADDSSATTIIAAFDDVISRSQG